MKTRRWLLALILPFLAGCSLLVIPLPFESPSESAEPVEDGAPAQDPAEDPATDDAPAPGVTVSPLSVSATEGGADESYSVVLDAAPTADVVVTPTAGSQVILGPTELTFTADTWDTPQSVTVAAVDDGDTEGNHNDTVTHSVSSSDTGYDGLAVSDVSVTIVDNDAPGVSVTPTSLSVDEAGPTSDSYDVVLTVAPTADVDVTVSVAGGEVSVAPASLTFTTANWDTAQTVTVTAVDDADSEGNHNDTVTHSVNSSDTGYDGLAVSDVSVSVADNDPAAVTYDANGASYGTAPTDATSYTPGDTVTTLANSGGLVQNGAVFAGWNTAADGSGTSYAAATGTFTITGDTTLFAEWDTSNNGFAGGSGTDLDPYQVATHEHLSNIRTDATTLAAEYVQTAHIDLNAPPWNAGSGWAPIGGDFSGVYDGGIYEIRDLLISRPTTSGVGLFTSFVGSTTGRIRNLALINVNVTGEWIVGAIAGGGDSTPASDSRIIDSYATGTVQGVQQIGGLVGRTRQISIINSFADVQVTASGNYAGGLVGWAGGPGPITDSYALGTVTGDDGVGGLVGYANGDSIANSYATGAVTGNTNVGGLVGLKDPVSVTASFYDTTTTGQTDNVAGESGTPEPTANMLSQATFTGAGWDFATIWEITDGTSYPHHQWYTGTEPTP